MSEYDEIGRAITRRLPPGIIDDDLVRQLYGERLMLAEITYYMPDHPSLLQSLIWQTLDMAPDLPRLHHFLNHWRRDINAPIHSVTVSIEGLVRPAQLNMNRVVGLIH